MTKQNSQQTDEQLMQAYREGSYVAFEELYERHGTRIYGYLKSRLSNAALVDDIFQDTFLRLHRHRRKYNREYPFLPWLFTLCRSSIVDAIRRQKSTSAPESSHNRDSTPIFNQTATEGPELDLGALSHREKQVIALRYYDDLSFDDIAQRLGIRPALARKVSSRAIARLRQFLSPGGQRRKNDR